MSTVLNHCHKDTYIIHVMTTQRHLYVLWRDVTDMYILHIIASQTHVYPPYHGVHKYTYSHVYSFCDITNTPTCILSVLYNCWRSLFRHIVGSLTTLSAKRLHVAPRFRWPICWRRGGIQTASDQHLSAASQTGDGWRTGSVQAETAQVWLGNYNPSSLRSLILSLTRISYPLTLSPFLSLSLPLPPSLPLSLSRRARLSVAVSVSVSIRQ